MLYYSTIDPSYVVGFREATISGQAPGKGLFFPSFIPHCSERLLKKLSAYSREAVAMEVIRPYVGDAIPAQQLEEIVSETVSFDFPLVAVNDNIYSLELFHGPTLAFKDVGARFMSRCLGYFMKDASKKVVVLVATSGDTGGAVANGFYGVEGVEVVILYPSGKVSRVQELQLTSPGRNITALEVEGNFDDCQRMVKQAFADQSLNEDVLLTSANSINVARWLPQQFYYFFALQQWQYEVPPVISVPSGNFGNICAGLLAHASGLPVQHFIAACNANDVVPRYLSTGTYSPAQARATVSNAMDVGDPSNFTRILQLFNNNGNAISEKMSATSITDNETLATVARVYQDHSYLMDPHTAVAYLALERYLEGQADAKGFVLSTAHPVKFPETIEPVIGSPVPVPDAIAGLLSAEKKSTRIPPDYDALRETLLQYAS